MSISLRRLFNSAGEATAIVGTAAAGVAPAGIGVVLIGGAASAGAARPAGTDGGTRAARWLDRRGQVGRGSIVLRTGRESNVRDRSPTGHETLVLRAGFRAAVVVSKRIEGSDPLLPSSHLPCLGAGDHQLR